MAMPFSYLRQIRLVLAVELVMIAVISAIVYATWYRICGDGIQACIEKKDTIHWTTLTLLSFARPFLLTPNTFFHLISGNQFGFFWGALFSIFSTALSTATIFVLGKLIGKRLVTPWLRSNLPQTHQFVRSQDYKIIFFPRLAPFFHFDLSSLLFGALDFRFKSLMYASILGELPNIIVTTYIASGGVIGASELSHLAFVGVAVLGVGLMLMEFWSRLHGRGMYGRLLAMYHELLYEVRLNNEIVKRYTIDPQKTPVLLLYGFFSSRRTLTIMERQLSAKGYDILSFNLGGLFGVFFTRGIMETARFIDEKLQRQFDRKNFNKIHIVAHSKGGLVALWWLLHLGGARYCSHVICMGTPFLGSRLTYLGLITPLGIIWRDLWQMRPGSTFLRSLRSAVIPDGVKITCMYSNKDRVAPGACGIYVNHHDNKMVQKIPMHHISHFEFLHKKEITEKIAEILKSPVPETARAASLPLDEEEYDIPGRQAGSRA